MHSVRYLEQGGEPQRDDEGLDGAAQLEATSGIILNALRAKTLETARAAGVSTISAPHGGGE